MSYERGYRKNIESTSFNNNQATTHNIDGSTLDLILDTFTLFIVLHINAKNDFFRFQGTKFFGIGTINGNDSGSVGGQFSSNGQADASVSPRHGNPFSLEERWIKYGRDVQGAFIVFFLKRSMGVS